MIKRLILLILGLFVFKGTVLAWSAANYPPDNIYVQFTTTNLPIVWIEVNNQTIDRENRITARMKIIHNGDGRLNYADTILRPNQHIDYQGYIALRYRGNTTFTLSDKKPYSFRTLDGPLESGGKKQKVEILGMGKDNNWALLAPYSDKSMIRDMLAFELARPWMEYTPDGRYCELFLDGIYYGVYILSEVVSGGKNRINLNDPGESGDELTGGYIMEVDRDDEVTYRSKYHPLSNTGATYRYKYILFQFKEPDYEDLTQNQYDYITWRIDQAESALWNYEVGGPADYEQFFDVTNFIDYQLSMELGHNVDGYRLSGKFFKRRDSEDPRFKMVLWDMNLAYGNSNYYQGRYTNTWMYNNNNVLYALADPFLIPFWWYRLNSNPDYTAAVKSRWEQYRRSNLRDDRLMATIDSLTNLLTSHGAERRNSIAWPRWGRYVWPNYYIAKNYQDEINYLKQWITERIAWMDEQLEYDPSSYLPGDVDGDGSVNIYDVTALVDYLLKTNPDNINTDNADCDQDGHINIYDLTTLIDYLLKGHW